MTKVFEYSRSCSIYLKKTENNEKLLINEKFSFEEDLNSEIVFNQKKIIKRVTFYQPLEELIHKNFEISKIFEKYSDKTFFEIFQFFSYKFGKKSGFFALNVNSKDFVEFVASSKHLQNNGEWSGNDVNENCETQQDSIKKRLNSMSFVQKTVIYQFFKGIQMFFHKIQSSKIFGNTITLVLLLNIIVLAWEHYGISADTDLVLSQINTICTLIFLAEFLIKLLGLNNYFRDFMNFLDFLVLTISIIDYALSQDTNFAALKALRIFRLFRILKIFRIFRYLTSITKII